MSEHPTMHEDCLAFLRHKADQNPQGLDLAVTDAAPAESYPEFPAAVWRCPHGERFWTQPTAAEAARLRALNGSTS